MNGAVTYEVDSVGNRLSRSSTLAALGGSILFVYNPNDEVANDDYDLNGNTISSGGHTYAYDVEGQLAWSPRTAGL